MSYIANDQGNHSIDILPKVNTSSVIDTSRVGVINCVMFLRILRLFIYFDCHAWSGQSDDATPDGRRMSSAQPQILVLAVLAARGPWRLAVVLQRSQKGELQATSLHVQACTRA